MKTFSTDAQAALEAGTAVSHGAVKIACSPTPVLVWGGYGVLTLDGDDYQGVGDKGLVSISGAAVGGSEQNITLALSGIETASLALLDATLLRRAPVMCWRLIYDGSGTTLLDAHVFTRGRLDQLVIEETPGGTATLNAMIEGAARGLGRSGGRMRTDADQRLIDANDGGFKGVSRAGKKTLYWGGRPPSTPFINTGSGGVHEIFRRALD